MDNYTLYFDGSCWPNPGGTAAYGFTLNYGGMRVAEGKAVIGTGPAMSNNVAEYAGLYEGLAAFVEETKDRPGLRYHLIVRGDSQLVIRQMNREWGAKSDKLYFGNYRMSAALVDHLKEAGVNFTFEWVPRELNTECDDLSKAHLQ